MTEHPNEIVRVNVRLYEGYYRTGVGPMTTIYNKAVAGNTWDPNNNDPVDTRLFTFDETNPGGVPYDIYNKTWYAYLEVIDVAAVHYFTYLNTLRIGPRPAAVAVPTTPVEYITFRSVPNPRTNIHPVVSVNSIKEQAKLEFATHIERVWSDTVPSDITYTDIELRQETTNVVIATVSRDPAIPVNLLIQARDQWHVFQPVYTGWSNDFEDRMTLLQTGQAPPNIKDLMAVDISTGYVAVPDSDLASATVDLLFDKAISEWSGAAPTIIDIAPSLDFTVAYMPKYKHRLYWAFVDGAGASQSSPSFTVPVSAMTSVYKSIRTPDALDGEPYYDLAMSYRTTDPVSASLHGTITPGSFSYE